MDINHHHISLPENGILIIGAGIAGLYAALKLAPLPVTILALGSSEKLSASAWAQGGLAAAIGEDDHIENHLQDTIKAGDSLVEVNAAKLLTKRAPKCIEDLIKLGIPFDREPSGNLSLALEAAHSHPRIVHIEGDKTGGIITKHFLTLLKQQENLTAYIGWKCTHLLKDENHNIRGIRAESIADPRQGLIIESQIVILATGGIGGLYSITTNPVNARGEGIALAAIQGAYISNAEFVQFHPTALNLGLDPAPLATEAIRGKGAKLVNQDGHYFMQHYHPDEELASRDIVARAIDCENKSGKSVFLDARYALGKAFAQKFPTVFNTCIKSGINPEKDLIPILPACHYHMGGIKTDLDAKTNLPGLWAIGECASTGVHGANRLASNSLIEALVFAERAAKSVQAYILKDKTNIRFPKFCSHLLSKNERLYFRKQMYDLAGICRSENTLKELYHQIILKIEQAWKKQKDTQSINYSLTTMLIIAYASLQRRESRGAHYRTDYPDQQNIWQQTLLLKKVLDKVNLHM